MNNLARNIYYRNMQERHHVEITPHSRNTGKELKFLPELAFIMALSLLFVFFYNFIIKYEYFKVSNIPVTGTVRISKEEIRRCAGICEGVNIFAINIFTAQKRLLANPWIAEAEISFSLPSEVNIHIKEHQPLAIFDLGRKFIANNHGKVFKEWCISDPENLPVVSGLKFSDINAEDNFFTIPFKAVMNVLQFGKNAESVIPNKFIKSIRIDREIGITILIADDNDNFQAKKIKLGYDDYKLKYTRLKELFMYLKKQETCLEIDSIDLNNLDRVVVSPIKTESLARDYKEV